VLDMASDATPATAAGQLSELVRRLEAQEGFAEVVASLKAGHAATLDGVWGSSCALVAAALAAHAPAVLVVVCSRLDEVDALVDDLALFTAVRPDRFAVRESLSAQRLPQDEGQGERLRVLKALGAEGGGRKKDCKLQIENCKLQIGNSQSPIPNPQSPTPSPPSAGYPLGGPPPLKIIVASIPSLLQPVPSREALAAQTRRLRVGEEVSPDELSGWLVRAGFQNTTAVELPGEFSLRGGILDIFAPDWYEPVRVEFFGDRIESLRQFEVSSQRSLAGLEAIDVTAIAEGGGGAGETASEIPIQNPKSKIQNPHDHAVHGARIPNPQSPPVAHLADYLPPGSWFLLIEPGELEAEGRRYLERIERPQDFHTVSAVLRRAIEFPSVTASAVAVGSLETTCRLPIESVERFSGDISRVRSELDEAGADQEVFLVCQTEAEVRRLGEVFSGTRVAREGHLHFPVGSLENGFRLVPDRIVLLSSAELFRRTDIRRTDVRRPATRLQGRVIDSFLELHEGDLVVHVAHGIARYRGLKLLEKSGLVEEHLELEFQGRTKLYVPVSKIALVQKYVGGQKSRPVLARLGGRAWEKQKAKVRSSVTDLAAEMLELQAVRASRPGISFTVDTEWQHEFDASFPYHETPDQLTTIEAIRRDMGQPRPMDRLLCGDVGYGKTEVAMRAAFKAIDSGYQVAVLVPTTVLAEQHLRTFTARMAEFPFEIAALSRFATRRGQGRIIERLRAGSLDIVVGTHRLVQPDVQFHNLGLVIIDEEQRFGVEVKERLKAFRQTVDVLTMTATPIPRTLHMGLVGLRDISNLETPPEDRLAVETRVARFQAELVRQAVLRELNRGGQIYFVHNRIQDIEVLVGRLRQVVPEARLAVAHGQMPEHELERTMLDFIDHRFDLLLATTIVESGLDIPNANTIFIDEADRYGLADLHQLRGRVGRYKHRAYCYLLIDPNKNLSPSAARRLRAIEEFSDMGAGFAIAMRDLEIRGAGNILGTQQSGHIAMVGYELYCSLLEQAVGQLKRVPPKESIEVDVDLPGEAYFPRSYVPDMRLKIDLYRRLVRVGNLAELEDFRGELLDRFGPPPPLVEHLLWLAELRIAAHLWGIESIRVENQYVVFHYTSAGRIRELAAKSGGRLRVVDARSAYLPLDEQAASPDAIRRQVKSLLQLA
ncbi:MAG: transcription-repair coupling factor, partial [Thermoguttaceae bacterium]